jgi:hypothetical protein
MSVQAPKRRPSWQQAYDKQMEAWRFVCSPLGRHWLAESWIRSSRGMNAGTKDMLEVLYRIEHDKLLTSDPIFVSSEMCEIVAVAYPDFRPEPLVPTDLVTLCGFMCFETPFVVKDRRGIVTDIHAVAWQPVLGRLTTEWLTGRLIEDGVGTGMMTRTELEQVRERFLTNDYVAEWASAESGDANVSIDGLNISLYSSTDTMSFEQLRGIGDGVIPSILPMHVTPWWFGMSYEENETDENGDETAADTWWKIVQTTFRLMQQRISHAHRERPERAARREGVRRGFHSNDVTIVRLRRESNPDEAHDDGESGAANYSHRFIVSGHWRDQWYPSESLHRQLWISPYVKGPEDKPLVVSPRRAFTWSR